MTALGTQRSALGARVGLVAITCAVSPARALACSVCFAANTGGVASSNAGIYVLLGATAIVLVGIGTFMRRLARLERADVQAPSLKPEACEVSP